LAVISPIIPSIVASVIPAVIAPIVPTILPPVIAAGLLCGRCALLEGASIPATIVAALAAFAIGLGQWRPDGGDQGQGQGADRPTAGVDRRRGAGEA
jgi:hypothetical protein